MLSYCVFHSLLHLLLFLAVGGSFVDGFPLPGGILVFTVVPPLFCDRLEGEGEMV